MSGISKNKFSQSIWLIYCIPFFFIAFSLIFFCVVGFIQFSTKGNATTDVISYFQGFYKINLSGPAGGQTKSFTLNANGWIAVVLMLVTIAICAYAYLYKYMKHVNTSGSIISTVTLFISLALVLLIFIFFVSASPRGRWDETGQTIFGGKWNWITKFNLPSEHIKKGLKLTKGGTFVEAWSIITGITIALLVSGSLVRTFKK